ncbi:FliA/WhiG family RNA polymerase sigma factor [Acidobacteria bacterium AB60]|nr:FliA/WhiG family RNA polymerase sigma factor [Acidobacteria bacterium AB60]
MTPAELAYKASMIDVDACNGLAMQELPQVYYIAARIHGRLPNHVELEDLVNAGVIGLLEASRTFDSSKNAQFKTFAKFRIRGAILDSLRELDWGSRTLRRKGRAVSDAIVRLEAKLGRQPAESEIAEELQIDQQQLQQLLAQLDSLYVVNQQSIASPDRSEQLDIIESAPSLDDPSPFDLCLQGEVKEKLSEAVAKLSEREQLIISLYYREELTMKEVAEVVGVAVSRVSQIHCAAMAKLRASLVHLQSPTGRDNRLGKGRPA